MKIIPGAESVVDWVKHNLPVTIDDFAQAQSIAITDNAYNIKAAVVYYNYRKTDIELAIYAKQANWASKHVITVLLSYPFMQLNCNRVTAMTTENNLKAIKLLHSIGFIHEGTLNNATLDNKPMLIFGMTKQQFLRSKWYGQKRCT